MDRGSFVKQGELLVQLSAPEMMAHISQAQAQLTSAESDETQAEAQLAAAQSTFSRLQEASKTPGAVAENDIVQAKQQTEAAEALVESRRRNVGVFEKQSEIAAGLGRVSPGDGSVRRRNLDPLRASGRSGRSRVPMYLCFSSIRSLICGWRSPFPKQMSLVW